MMVKRRKKDICARKVINGSVWGSEESTSFPLAQLLPTTLTG